MPLIAHLSDLHFGKHDERVVEAAEERIGELAPDLVAISGDFTQRARRRQFKLASAFVARLEAAGHRVMGVPGNHDIPLYDVFRRFFAPTRRYRRHLGELCPVLETEAMVVAGINTARSLTIKDGFVDEDQIEKIHATFAAADAGKVRILVTHHPLHEIPLGGEHGVTKAVDDHHEVLAAIRAADVHFMLAGHFHMASVNSATDMTEHAGPALVIQAGTATSTRLRGDEPQSFNLIDCTPGSAVLTVQRFEDGSFSDAESARYERTDNRWRRI